MRVVGVGNRWRGDDGAGLDVARRVVALRADVDVIEHEGDCTRLLELMPGDRDMVIVDAAMSSAPPGTVHRLDVMAAVAPRPALRSSTHAFGVADAIELARSLGRLPARLRVYAIEGERFDAGARLSPAVEAAARALAEELAGRRA